MKNIAYTRLFKMIVAQYLRTQPIATVQCRLGGMQDSTLSSKADEIQTFGGRNDLKMFYNTLKTIYWPLCSGATPLLRVQMEVHF